MINKKMSLKDFALHVANELKKANINVVLTGGAVVSIYTENKYQSKDVDFISPSMQKDIREAMAKMGFIDVGKDFTHPNSDFTVEFPGYDLIIGEEPMKPEGKITKNKFTLLILSPTQCVMDRLAAFYHWDDRQSLDQAVLVAENQPINISKIKKWSKNEGMLEKFLIFQARLKG